MQKSQLAVWYLSTNLIYKLNVEVKNKIPNVNVENICMYLDLERN